MDVVVIAMVLHLLLGGKINPRRCDTFYSIERVCWGGGVGPPAVRPLIELVSRRKKKRACRSQREEGTQLQGLSSPDGLRSHIKNSQLTA